MSGWGGQEDFNLDNICFVDCPDGVIPGEQCDLLGFAVSNQSNDDCCLDIDFRNTNNTTVGAVAFSLSDGAVFADPLAAAGLDFLAVTDQEIVVGNIDGSPLPAQVNGLLQVCLAEVFLPEQEVIIEYLAEDFRTLICTDTIRMNCPISPVCLVQDALSPQLDCEDDGYRLRLIFEKPEGYVDSTGLIKVHITHPPALEGTLRFPLDTRLGPGDMITVDTLLSTPVPASPDSLCIIITAHDGPEERLCCFADSLCIPFPICDPCDYIDVYATPDEMDSCCYYLVIDDRFPEPGYFDSLSIDTITGFGFGATTTNVVAWPNNSWQIGAGPDGETIFGLFPASAAAGTDTVLYFCLQPSFAPDSILLGVDIFHQGELACRDTTAVLCPAESPCDSLNAYLEVSEEGDCCYDVFLDNAYDLMPDLLTGVTITLLGDVPDFSGFDRRPLAPGWNLASVATDERSFTLTPSGDAVPLGPGQQVFKFCLDESFNPDSTYVEVGWTTETDTICADTLAAFCPGCLTAITDTLYCEDGDYVYRFSFTNYSEYAVNTVTILPQEDNPEMVTNAQTFTLPQTVPVGGTYSGVLPVEFMDVNGDGEFCFDIVLRQVIAGEIPILCCFATHCITVPDCSTLAPPLCQDGRRVSLGPIRNYLDFVHGCTERTLANWTYANRQTLTTWWLGISPLDDGSLTGYNFPRYDEEQEIHFHTNPDLPEGENAWDWFAVQRRPFGSSEAWETVAYPCCPPLPEDRDEWPFEFPLPGSAAFSYRVAAVATSGHVYFSRSAVLSPGNPGGVGNLNLSPNPTNGDIALTSTRSGPATIRVLNLSGHLNELRRVAFTDEPVRLQLGNLPPGVYTIVVTYPDGEQQHERVIVR